MTDRLFPTIFLLCLLTGGQAYAARQDLVLSPVNTQALLHARSSLTDIDGSFGKVSGTLTYDLDRQTCHVDMTMNVSSLKVGSAVMKQIMLSGIMLDSDDHPVMKYVGDCRPRIVKGQLQTELAGQLTMRGQTHPLVLTTELQFQGNTLMRIASHGSFDQRQWGMSTLLHSVDPMVRVETRILMK
ncbi:YceI family protein [Gluconobacter sp. Dm-62]|uniref:YceI family protein n=1 Tax=Gluconobacter sp. Dm-62 TaxID=2799804 RepID=UPI001B8CEF82|nr:YceI family protein [Gluconobacter sp. Dm-62]MBS1103617.1 YceI family protein [Gluconobacter sp. Dm-62]